MNKFRASLLFVIPFPDFLIYELSPHSKIEANQPNSMKQYEFYKHDSCTHTPNSQRPRAAVALNFMVADSNLQPLLQGLFLQCRY